MSALIQFVCFETSLSRASFLDRWQAFASTFLARGIERIVLGERHGAPGAYGFVSRNLWPEPAFQAAFGGRLPDEGGRGGPVIAVQAGGFRVAASEAMQPLVARDGVVKITAFARCAPDARGATVDALGSLAAQHGQGLGWSTYIADPATSGGRFDAVLELYSATDAAARLCEAVVASAASDRRLREVQIQRLSEVLALPTAAAANGAS